MFLFMDARPVYTLAVAFQLGDGCVCGPFWA